MKAGWRVVPLGDLVEIKPPKREAQSRLQPNEPVSFVPMEDLKELQRSFAPKQVRPLAEVYGGYTYFANDDVLLAKITPCFENGKLSIARHLENGVGFGSSEFMVLRCGKQLDPEYLFYFLSRSEFRETGKSRMTGAVGHKRVPPEFVQAQPIPLPPLDEQKRIVAVLDEAFEGLSRARANAEDNLADARELFRRCLEVDFSALAASNPRRTIGDVAIIKGGKRLPKGDTIVPTVTPYPYISIKDFNDLGSVNIASVGYLMPRTREAIKNYIIRSEDLYISIAGTIGKTGIVPAELDGANLTENAARMIFKEGVNNEYVYFFTLTDDFQEQAGLNTRTAAQPKLALERLKTISLPVAPLKTQIDLSARFRSIREQSELCQSCYQDKIRGIETLRQSLLQKAFLGELT